MRRVLPWCFLLALLLSVPAPAAASVSVGITLGNAPPPPMVVFRGPPRMVIMPHTDLWYYEGPSDYDYFRYGPYFYIYNGGYWYRARHYRGPFIAIREVYVPRVFYGLHDRGYHWRHGWKPAHIRKMERKEYEREYGHKYKGKDKDKHGHKHGDKHDKD